MMIWYQNQLDVLMCMACIQWVQGFRHPVRENKIFTVPVI